jgi:hypothetical protein
MWDLKDRFITKDFLNSRRLRYLFLTPATSSDGSSLGCVSGGFLDGGVNLYKLYLIFV